MNTQSHPADLSPYLDGDRSDARYEQIWVHLAACRECLEEVRAQESLGRLMRSREFELDLPPFQWQRLRARLEAPRPKPGWRQWLAAPQLAWGAVLALLIAVAAVTGWEHRKASQEWFALNSYAASEGVRLAAAENPFRSSLPEETENPFYRYQTFAGGNRNPFAVR